MPDSKRVFQEANKKVGKGKETVHETLLRLKNNLKAMLKDVEAALQQTEDWNKISDIDLVQQQIRDSRWNH